LKYLLDTNALIWYLAGSDKITDKVLKTIRLNENQIYFSAINIIKISIKVSIGKLKMPSNYLKYLLVDATFKEVTLNSKHADRLQKLPFIHKDPFDRLLIAQAKVEKFTIITSDDIFKKYHIPVLTI